MRHAFFFAFVSACSAQFDFDTEPLDAAAPEAAMPDVTGSSDAIGPGEIACGAMSCALPLQVCCVTPTRSTCVEASQTALCSDLVVRCDSSNDCASGHVCCARPSDGGLASVQCRDTAACTAPGDVVLCDPNDSAECSACAPASPPVPAGYYRCF